MREILFYRTHSGQSPIEEFLDQLSAKQAQKIAWVLKLIEELEHIPAQYFRKMVHTEDLWEVRVTAGSNIFRLLGFFGWKQNDYFNTCIPKEDSKNPKASHKNCRRKKERLFEEEE